MLRRGLLADAAHTYLVCLVHRKNDNLKVPPPDTRTKVQQVLKTSSAKVGGPTSGNIEHIGTELAGELDVEDGDPIDSADGQTVTGPNRLDPVAEEYKEEQAFRRWVASQVCEQNVCPNV